MDKAIKTPIPSGGLGWSAIGEEEIGAVTALLRNPERLWRYREDSESGSFERELRETLGVRHALMVNSGTSALSCCLAGLGVGAGDEVIVQGYTYVATASSCMDVGAVPIVAEIDGSLGLDPADVERKVTPRTKAVIMAHMQGVPGRIEAVRETAKKHGLYMVEDCCQAIGARYLGEHVGVRSDAFAWSLNFFKNITCGEGGVFFTDRDDVFQGGFCQSDPASALWKDRPASAGSVPGRYFSKGCYRSNEICAAVARAQLKKLEGMLGATRRLKARLLSELEAPRHYVLQHVDDPEGDCGISCALIVGSAEEYGPFTARLAEEGLPVGAAYKESFPDRHIYCYWDALYQADAGNPHIYPWNSPLYGGSPDYRRDMCPRTLDILSRSLRIPIHPGLSGRNVSEMALAINRADASF